MNNAMQIVNYGNSKINTAEIDGEFAACAKDIAKVLGFKDPTNAIKKHCKGVAILYPLETDGGTVSGWIPIELGARCRSCQQQDGLATRQAYGYPRKVTNPESLYVFQPIQRVGKKHFENETFNSSEKCFLPEKI